MSEKIRDVILGLKKVRGITNEELGNELGVSVARLKAWYGGKTSQYDLAVLIHLFQLAEVSFDETFGLGKASEQSPDNTSRILELQEERDTYLSVLKLITGQNNFTGISKSGYTEIANRSEGPAKSIEEEVLVDRMLNMLREQIRSEIRTEKVARSKDGTHGKKGK